MSFPNSPLLASENRALEERISVDRIPDCSRGVLVHNSQAAAQPATVVALGMVSRLPGISRLLSRMFDGISDP